MSQIQIAHFSDILCIWAYVSQIRIEELETNFGDKVKVDYRLFPVFGNVRGKIETQWKGRGGLSGYSQHVTEVAQQFEHLEVHPEVWLKATPCSSLPSHLYLCAVRLAESEGRLPAGSMSNFKKFIRNAFFKEQEDVSKSAVLMDLAKQMRYPTKEIEEKIASGEAYASLADDMQQARDLFVRSSPTLIFNEDRQRLAGNVGYRIIEANVRELLEHPGSEQTWC